MRTQLITAVEFEEIVEKHSLCPNNLLYNSNALAGEAGETANCVKKIQMATIRPEWVTQNEHSLPTKEHFENCLNDELSDLLFYVTRLAKDNGTTLEDLMIIQHHKLKVQSDKYNRVFLK